MPSDTISKPPITSGKRAFVEHYGSTTIAQGLTLGLGILTGILSARMLGPVGRGEFAAVIIWPMGIAGFLALGISQSIVFYLGKRTFTRSELATSATAIGLVLSALSIIIGFAVVPVALAKYSPTAQHLAILFVLLTPTVILGGYSPSLFQGEQDLLRFNIIRLVPALTYAGGLVALGFLHRANLTTVVYSQLAGYVLSFAFGLFLAWRVLKIRVQWNASAIKPLTHYGVRIQSLSIATYFNQRMDQIVLSQLVPPQQLGYYAVAVTLSTAVAIFPQAAGIVAFSRGSSQPANDARTTIGVAFRASLSWLLVSCGALYILAPFLIRFVYGGAFNGSILACRILVPGALVIGLNQVLYNGASALGRPGLSTVAEGVSMGVTAIGLIILVPRYGYIGAAMVSSLAYTISFLIMLVLAHRLLGLSLRTLFVGK